MPPIEGDGTQSPPPGGAAAGIEDAYRCHAVLLREIAERKFNVPPGDAEGLVNEVFLSFLHRSGEVRDPRRWLIGAVCHASRGYWRTASKTDPLPEDIDDYADPRAGAVEQQIVDTMTMAHALSRLGPKCRETLRMYYCEGYTAAEIAEHLGTSSGYVMQLLHNCRKRARDMYNALLPEKKK